MSGFKEHFLDKYFAYRRRYVDYFAREAPERASLAVLSEIARLGFLAVGSAFCAVIFAVLSAGAASRPGAGVWIVVFGLCALVPALFAALAVRGVTSAVRDLQRVKGASS